MKKKSNTSATAKTSDEKIVLDFSRNNCQMEGIRPGEGKKIGFHELNFDITGDSFNWIYTKVSGGPSTIPKGIAMTLALWGS